MSETLYPTRLRCKQCRKGLEGTPVVDGMYCSYRCAKVPAPSANIADAPRGCKRQVNGDWGFKTRYKYEGAVPQRLRDDPASNVYRCDYCRNLHVGHNAPIAASEAKLHRAITDFQQAGSVIQRHRESLGIDKKVLAKKMKVPAIRITEIENGSKTANPEILFQLLSTLRIVVEFKSR